MSQAQPVIPVTMQYGDSSRHHNEYNHIEREVYRTGDSVRNEVSRSKDQIRDDVRDSTAAIRTDLSNDTATIVANLVAQANADQSQTRSSQIETRQAVERNSDFVNNNLNRTNTASLLATQNTSTATQLAVQNTSADLKTGLASIYTQLSAVASVNQTATVIGQSNLQQTILTQAQAILLGQKDREVKSSDQHGAALLQASEFSKEGLLQAANYKAYLENHITKTAAEGILKTTETTAKIMEKLMECCCENKMAHVATQNVVMQNGNNNQVSIQQGQFNQLQQQLLTSQQDALISRLASSGARGSDK